MELSIVQTIVLAVVQGITEFLPVSSSGHLALAPVFFGFDDPGLAFGAALHIGTLLAVIVYFAQDLRVLVRSVTVDLADKQFAQNRRLVVALAVATVPAAIAGFLWEDIVAGVLRNPQIIGVLLIFGSLALYLADKYSRANRAQGKIGIGDAVWVGLAQAVAIVPGVSRSGMTIAAGRVLGLTREAATRFSFLMSVPIIAGAFFLELPQVMAQGFSAQMLVGAAVSFVVAYAAIALFLRFIAQISFSIFVWYSIIIAIIIFILI